VLEAENILPKPNSMGQSPSYKAHSTLEIPKYHNPKCITQNIAVVSLKLTG
jgi:hypothetical protein